MNEGTVGVLNVEFQADLTNLQSGFASAKAQVQNLSGLISQQKTGQNDVEQQIWQ